MVCVRLSLSKNRYNQIYIPNDVRQLLKLSKEDSTIQGIANTQSILLIRQGTTAEAALKSLEVIKAHLEHELEIEKTKK